MSPHDRAAYERALRRLRDLHPEEFSDLYDEEAANEDPPPPISVIANK